MKQKNYLFIGILALILVVLIIGINLRQDNSIEDNFLYKTGEIPQDKLISSDANIDTSEIKGGPCTGCASSPSYICKNNNEATEKIEISRPPEENKGGEIRYALVCDDNYYILRSFGSAYNIYGPFEK